jgi:hypothetical protein
MIKNQTHKDVFLIVFLLILSYIGTYLSPNIVRAIIYTGIVFFFIRTKNNAPWVVFFFFLFSAPATLFYGPNSYFLLLTPTVGIPFSFIVALSFLFKGLQRKERRRNRFAFERNLYLFVLFFLFLVGYVQGGISFKNIFLIVRNLPNILFILYLPLLIDLKKDSVRIKKLLYIFTIILFIIQLYDIVFGHSLFNVGKLIMSKEDGGLQRNITGIYFVFFAFILSLTDVLSNRSKIKSLEFITVFLSILILINSATRGWMIATGFILISLLFLGNKPKVALISLISTVFISLFLIIGSAKYINNLAGSFDRLSSVILVVEGDETAGGTLSRVTERGPRVMKEFKKSPIIGFGYSDKMMEYYDGHVGNQAILLHSGIFGFTALYVIMISILWYIFNRYLALSTNNIIKFRILSMLIGFLGIMVIHLSSRIMVGFRLGGDNAMLLAFWFLYTFYYLDEAKKYERK